MDQYESVRNLPLAAVLTLLGFSEEWKARKNGQEWYGRCPIHGPKKNTNSFSFAADGKWHCFSCGAKGRGAIDLTMAVRQVGFRDAVELLKGLDPDTVRFQAPEVSPEPAPTENEPFQATYEKFKVDSPWLTARGIGKAMQERYGVFEYRNDKRRSVYNGSVMLRISRYSDSACVGYLSRNIGDITPEKPKYRFPKAFHKSLEVFGAWQIKFAQGPALPLRVGYIVESPFTVMKWQDLGYPAVSPFGFSLSEAQIRILKELAKGWCYVPDRNKQAEVGPFVAALARSCWVKVPGLPEGIDDPEQMTDDQIRKLAWTRQNLTSCNTG